MYPGLTLKAWEKRRIAIFGYTTETSLNLFFFIYFQESEFSGSAFECHENWKTRKEKRLKLVSMLSPKMFYSHPMFLLGDKSQKGSRFFFFRLIALASRGTKADFNLNNIIATLSLISIFSPKKFAGKCQTWSQLRHVHSMNAKAGEHRRSEPCGLDVTISACYDWSVERQFTSLQQRHWNLRNLTLHLWSITEQTHGNMVTSICYIETRFLTNQHAYFLRAVSNTYYCNAL